MYYGVEPKCLIVSKTSSLPLISNQGIGILISLDFSKAASFTHRQAGTIVSPDLLALLQPTVMGKPVHEIEVRTFPAVDSATVLRK